MLELGKYSKKLQDTFNKIRPQKKGKILNSKNEINKFLKYDVKNGEYLMIKGSNSTGLNVLVKKLKKDKINAL